MPRRLPVALLWLLLAACGVRNETDPQEAKPADPEYRSAQISWEKLREAMVTDTIVARGIDDPRVLSAMRAVPRHEFVPGARRGLAYGDHPLLIGEGQTISQPYIVAFMTDVADIKPGAKVLEIGTGSGYGAAVLSQMAKEVFTIEIIESLAKRAERTLRRLGYENVRVRYGDGYGGWPEEAPFDAIVVTAAPPRIPEPLKEQLKIGGNLVIPVGESRQEMRVLTRTKDGFVDHGVLAVRFVPMTGEAQDK